MKYSCCLLFLVFTFSSSADLSVSVCDDFMVKFNEWKLQNSVVKSGLTLSEVVSEKKRVLDNLFAIQTTHKCQWEKYEAMCESFDALIEQAGIEYDLLVARSKGLDALSIEKRERWQNVDTLTDKEFVKLWTTIFSETGRLKAIVHSKILFVETVNNAECTKHEK